MGHSKPTRNSAWYTWDTFRSLQPLHPLHPLPLPAARPQQAGRLLPLPQAPRRLQDFQPARPWGAAVRDQHERWGQNFLPFPEFVLILVNFQLTSNLQWAILRSLRCCPRCVRPPTGRSRPTTASGNWFFKVPFLAWWVFLWVSGAKNNFAKLWRCHKSRYSRYSKPFLCKCSKCSNIHPPGQPWSCTSEERDIALRRSSNFQVCGSGQAFCSVIFVVWRW